MNETVRRLLIFGAVFGSALVAINVLGGGFVGDTAAPHEDTEAAPGRPGDAPEGEPQRTRGVGVGSGKGGRYEHVETGEIGGRTREYVAWEANWNTASPRASEDPENPILQANGCSLSFYPPLSEKNPDPKTGVGPGTVRVDADHAEIHRHADGVRVDADLRGDVVLTHYDRDAEQGTPAGDLDTMTLETEILRVSRAANEAVTVSTEEAVRLRGPGHSLDGTGLSADTDLGSVEIATDVRGRFETARGRIDVDCAGTARIESLDPREGVDPRDRRIRRVTFHEKVRTVHDGTLLTCRDRLLVEVPRSAFEGEEGDQAERTRITRLEAYGDVLLSGESSRGPYRISSEQARRWIEDGDVDVMVFEGGTEMVFDGALHGGFRGESKARPTRNRIRCKGPATLRTRPHPKTALARDGLRRFAVTFVEDVVVSQHDLETGEEIARLEAPFVNLYGDQSANTSLQPETLNAKDGVHLVHGAFDGRAQVALWTIDPVHGTHRVLLNGAPRITFENAKSANPLGGGRGKPGTLILTAASQLEILFRPPPKKGEPAPAPGTVAITAIADKDVHVRKVVDETEPYHLRADHLVVHLDHDKRLLGANAHGNAHLTGRAEDGSGRRGEARGTKIEITDPEGAAKADEIATAKVIGERGRPAEVTLHDEKGRRHHLRARTIEYLEEGTVVKARQDAHAVLSRPAPKTGESDSASAALERTGPIQVVARIIRADLRKTTDGEGEDAKSKSQLRRVTAIDRVRLWGTDHDVTGDTVTFDAVSGVAIAEGRPAKAALRETLKVGKNSTGYTSWVRSPKLRAEFQLTGENRGQLLRASCQGGVIQRFLVPQDDPQEAVVERVVIQAQGPIVIERKRGSASQDVSILYERPTAGGRWARDTTVLCDRIDFEFEPEGDPDNPTEDKLEQAQDRIRRIVAVGRDDYPVRFDSKRLAATADRMETTEEGTWVHLSAEVGRGVELRDKTESTVIRCEEGVSVNYRTFEWKAHGRTEILTD